MSETISGIVERFAERMVVIKTDSGEELFWPVKNLPAELAVGSKVNLTLSTESNGQFSEKELQAKKMLNDILNVEPERSARQL